MGKGQSPDVAGRFVNRPYGSHTPRTAPHGHSRITPTALRHLEHDPVGSTAWEGVVGADHDPPESDALLVVTRGSWGPRHGYARRPREGGDPGRTWHECDDETKGDGIWGSASTCTRHPHPSDGHEPGFPLSRE